MVLLAAGLDTRAYRLEWPSGVRVFEIDLPEVLSFKEARLSSAGASPRCERVVVPADLREDWPGLLTSSGFDASTPTAWLAEGVLIYLDADEASRLLRAIGDLSAAGSRLSFERGGSAARSALPRLEGYTSLWKGGLGEDAAGRLARNGWRPESHDLSDLAASYGCPIRSESRSGFVTATCDG